MDLLDAIGEDWSDLLAVVGDVGSRLTKWADALAEGDPAARLSQREIVKLAARVPGARYADVLAREGEELVSVLTSEQFPRVVDEIRRRSLEGPCYEALEQGGPVVCQDLAIDGRWPDFRRRALQSSHVRSIASYRLHLPAGRSGVLSVYSEWPFALDPLSVATGKLLAGWYSLGAEIDDWTSALAGDRQGA